jgi:type II secretory pathway component GspD/PulD (secretin)
MKRTFFRSPHRLTSHVALWSSFLHFSGVTSFFTNTPSTSLYADIPDAAQEEYAQQHTINFNGVSAAEVLRFVSKITGANFIFAEEDLQFGVTIVSEEPISAQNILATLIQVLRIHGLKLLEQDGNFLIVKTGIAVNQIPTIVTDGSDDTSSPIVTRIFSIKNMQPVTLASIIKPMTSASSLIEILPDTNKLIVTDITANIEKIFLLIQALDVPNSNLEIESYVTKSVSVEDVISLTKAILAPFLQGNPLLLIPQKQNNTIFIVSTSYLIEQTLSVMEDIDLPAPSNVVGSPSSNNLDIHIYKVLNQTPENLISTLQTFNTADSNLSPTLVQAIQGVRYISNTGSLVFICSTEDWQKIQDILANIDGSPYFGPTGKASFWIYKIQNSSPQQLQSSLKQFASGIQDQTLQDTISSMDVVSDINSIIFNGPQAALTSLQTILPALDVAAVGEQMQLFVYQVQHVPESQIAASLEQLSDTIQSSDFSFAIQNMKWVPSSGSIIFHGTAATIAKLQSILPSLDNVANEGKNGQVYMYKIQVVPEAQIASALNQMANNSQDKALITAIANMQWIQSSNTLVFTGSADVLAKLQNIVPSLDTLASNAKNTQLFMYKIVSASESQLIADLDQMSENIDDQPLISAIASVKWIQSSNTLSFTGTTEAIAKLQNILPYLDVPNNNKNAQFYMYKIETAPEPQIAAALSQMAETVRDPALVSAINSMKWLQSSNTLLFTGSTEAISKLQNILPTLDTITLQNAQANSQFLVYTPKNKKKGELREMIDELAEKLKNSGLQNNPLLLAFDSMDLTANSDSLVFTGDPSSLAQVQTILQNFDTQTVGTPTAQAFIYKPLYASQDQLQNALAQFAQNLDPTNPSDQALAQAIYDAQWSSDSSSFVFKADASTLARLKTALKTLDSPQGLSTTEKGGFYLYVLQYVPGNIILNNITTLAHNLPSSDPNSQAIIKAIQETKWIKDNNSLLITGSPYIIDQVKALIGQFDISSAQPTAPTNSEFFIYKPVNGSAEQVQDMLTDLMENLEASGLSDVALMQTLKTSHLVSSTNTLLFTGTTASLAKLKTLLATIDTNSLNPTPIQTLGETSFLIYKIKQAPSEQLIQALQNFGSQLSSSNIADQELYKCLNSVKWIKDTNSLLFTGPTDTLQKVEALAGKFDLGTIAPPVTRQAPSTFFVYNPQSQAGNELIAILHEFMQNLIRSGVSDPQLFDAINHLKFIEKTNSLIISGDTDSIDRIKALLLQFDVASQDSTNQTGSTEDSANFLIYKLQYHPGADIQLALQKVVASLTQSADTPNTALVDAINSLQWVEVTNSLLGTGDAETLPKVKSLIASLDVPLRQVFIEVLVVETALFNSQNFGLQWGSQFQYLNKTIGAMGNFPTSVTNNNNNSNNPPGTLNLSNPLSFATNTNTPVQGNPNTSTTAVPFSTGFDLGVIGDILFHKGQSFISLGSLLNALQVDNDTTVVMNPKIITQDGHTSSIFVGQNIPFVGSFVSNSSSSTVQSSNIEYRDVGFHLTITPTLGTSNIITLDINQDISEQSGTTTQVQGAQVTGIQTSHTTMNTRVHVPDKHFLVLSGMIQDTKTHFRSGIPCLGGLPVIGALFAENDRANTKSNIIIFLRPFIIDSYADYDRLTADEEALYKEQAALQDLKEEFDAGTEMIKNLHNE